MGRLHVISRWLCAAMIASLVFLPMPSAAQSHSADFVYVEGVYLMLNGERFIVKGYNYLPRDYGWTSMADWNWEAVDRDVALAREYGANTIRTGLSWVTATGDRSCEQVLTVNRVRPQYLETVQKLVGLAEKHNLRLILWLGDLCDIFLDPAYHPGLQNCIESIIPFFADNP